jgi:prepilin-type N-terminal cleavage/methylation domain-containing protein
MQAKTRRDARKPRHIMRESESSSRVIRRPSARANSPLRRPSPRADSRNSNRRSLRRQCGYTLIEVLVVASVLVLVIGALMAPMVTSANVQKRDTNYAYAQQEARTGLDSMVAQIRQAWAILSTQPNAVEMNVNLNGVAEHVYYECDIPQPGSAVYRECLRVQSAAGTSLPALSTGSVVIKNLTNGTSSDPIFSFAPDPVAPYYMTATVKVPASDAVPGGLTHSITFSDGALMRNQNVGN